MAELPPIRTSFDKNGKVLDGKRKGSQSSDNPLLSKKIKTEDTPEYLAEVQAKVDKFVSDVLVSIYFDINYVCIIRNAIKWSPVSTNVTYYRLQYRESAPLIDQAASNTLGMAKNTSFVPTKLPRRLELFALELGWKTLSICVLSEGFRRACREVSHGSIWNQIVEKIKENRWSLEVFARTRDLDWRGPLLKYTHYPIQGLKEELEPGRKMWDQHPHHTVQESDDKVRRPRFEGHPQIHIDHCIFDRRRWGPRKRDPTARKPRDGECSLCFSVGNCKCVLDPWAGSLVELVDRPVTGVGVRALANFKKGDILGQFIGEICPPDYDGDSVYSLAQESKGRPNRIIATISPSQYGNWTRYIAHSCNSSTMFFCRTIGDRTVMTVEAIRDIPIFEDITIDYGEGYWQGRTCKCGQPGCVSNK